jgi:hypothetical protein
MAVSYVIGGSPAGGGSFNIVSGAGSYETTGFAPSGYIGLSGTFAIGDQISVTVGTLTKTYTVNVRTAGSNQMIAAGIAADINRTQPFGLPYVALSYGSEVVIHNIAYSTAGNTTAFAASTTSSGGTVSVSGATLSGGSAGVLPVTPALDNSNFPDPTPPFGQDSQTAVSGNALFPVDMALNFTADVPAILYPVYPKTFDAIWPAASELTLRLVTNGTAAGTLDVIVWAVPYDNHSAQPELSANYFLPSQTSL